jgi:hypothetical protein
VGGAAPIGGVVPVVGTAPTGLAVLLCGAVVGVDGAGGAGAELNDDTCKRVRICSRAASLHFTSRFASKLINWVMSAYSL